MGAKQSKPIQANSDAQLQRRLQTLTMHEKRGDTDNIQPPPAYADVSHDVSINTAEQWEKELMSDAKNRLAMVAFTSNNVNIVPHSTDCRSASLQHHHSVRRITGN